MAAFEAWLVFLILVVNVVGELQWKRTLAASRGFLAAARLSCLSIFMLDGETEMSFSETNKCITADRSRGQPPPPAIDSCISLTHSLVDHCR